MITINHERFGMRQEFDTLEEAQVSIRACGPEFADVTLSEGGGNVYDERDEIVGEIKRTPQEELNT